MEPRLSILTWPFWPNKRTLLEDRWLTTLHPPATRWFRLILGPAIGLAGIPVLYEWLYALRKTPPSFSDLQRIADGPVVHDWWKSMLASGVLRDVVAPEFLGGVLSHPRSVDRIHEISYFYERTSQHYAEITGETTPELSAWRQEHTYMTLVSDIEMQPPVIVEPELTEQQQDVQDYEDMVRLTIDPNWWSAAYHDPSSPRLFNEWLDHRVRMRKNIMSHNAHEYDVWTDSPYNTNWQMDLADVLLFPPTRLWLPVKRVNALIPDDALRLTTTWEIRAKDAEPRFVAATLCPRLVSSKEEDVCITLNASSAHERSFLWWQNWETRNSAGRSCSGTMLRVDYSGPRGVRDGRPLRGSRIPRLPVGVKSWEGTAPVTDDAVHHVAGPDVWWLRNSGKMQEQWVYDHDMINPEDAFVAEQFAAEEMRPFAGEYHQYSDAYAKDGIAYTVPPSEYGPWQNHMQHMQSEQGLDEH